MDRCTRRNLLKLASLALLARATPLAGQVRDRSVLDDQPRRLDQLDLPQMPERQSQIGYEVRTKEFVVVAKTGREDARTAVGQMQQAWSRSGELADHWTKVHRRPAFGIGAVQLVIDNEPVRQNDQPLVTINVVGIQTQIAINVSPGRPSLRDQMPRIREATAWAFLHTAECDEQLPAWVCNGLATYVATEGSPLSATVADLSPLGESLGGQQWKGTRSEPGTLDFPKDHRIQAALHVRYLLEASDAELAPQFFGSLRQTARAADQYWAQERRDTVRQAGSQLKRREHAIDDFAAARADGYEPWLKNPEMGQPIFEPAKGASADVVDLQRQMVTVLKLARRFAAPKKSASRVKVASFDPETRTAIPDSAQPIARSIDDLYRQLTDPRQDPWATLGPDGRLLFSTETNRLRRLLAIDTGQFRLSSREGRDILSTPSGNRSTLQAWLEENKNDPTRPIAKFAMVDPATGQRR